MIECSLGLRFTAAIERDFEDDSLPAEGKVSGEENTGRSASAQQRKELEFLEVIARLGEFGCTGTPTRRLAEEVVVLKLGGERILPAGIMIAKRLDVNRVAALLLQTEFLVNKAQDSSIGCIELGKLSEIVCDIRGLTAGKPAPHVGADHLRQQDQAFGRVLGEEMFLFGPPAD